MNTYTWTCTGCTTPNYKFVEPEDGKQVELNCGNCGHPAKDVKVVPAGEFVPDMATLKTACSTHSTSTYVEGLVRPLNWRI